MKKLVLTAGSAAVLAACASAPDYREARSSGEQGYSAQAIESNRYRVTYTGDEDQSPADVRHYALLRSAELTMEKGGDWFEVVAADTNEDRDTRLRGEPGGFETDTAFVRDCGLLGCTTRAQPVTRYESGDVREVSTSAYAHTMEIIVHTGLKPTDSPNAYDASQTAANLRGRAG